MSNNKQSSVEFLIKQKEKYGMIINDDLRIAKAMHEEEIIDAHGTKYYYSSSQIDPKKVTGEQYYNETFGGNK